MVRISFILLSFLSIRFPPRRVHVVGRILVPMLILVSHDYAIADTALKIDLQFCHREVDNSVICEFAVASTQDNSYALTGGQYSQAQDTRGETYDAVKVQIGEDSGMAVFFDIAADDPVAGKLFFKNVDSSIVQFNSITMRFNDGTWHISDVAIKNN